MKFITLIVYINGKTSRSPHGERGLKSRCVSGKILLPKSLPARGAWIEIRCANAGNNRYCCRSPHGERGLKCLNDVLVFRTKMSLPARGAWIEIRRRANIDQTAKSLPARGAWIEISLIFFGITILPSLPARGAWIEIQLRRWCKEFDIGRSPHGERGLKYDDAAKSDRYGLVAPRTGSVD